MSKQRDKKRKTDETQLTNKTEVIGRLERQLSEGKARHARRRQEEAITTAATADAQRAHGGCQQSMAGTRGNVLPFPKAATKTILVKIHLIELMVQFLPHYLVLINAMAEMQGDTRRLRC